MYIHAEDAKTDVILAAAVAVLGTSLRSFVMQLPLYPGGSFRQLLDVVWVLLLSVAVPIALAQYRGDRRKAFAWHGFNGVGRGLLLAVPIPLAATFAVWMVGGGHIFNTFFARFTTPITGIPSGGGLADPMVMFTFALNLLLTAAYALGALLLPAFLAVRSRDGFSRSPDMHLTQLIRTIGLGAVVVALIGGLLSAVGGSVGGYVVAAVNAFAMAAIVLLADWMIPAGIRLPRAAIIGPVVVVAVGKVFATGGLFFGDLLSGLTHASLAVGVTLAIAGLAHTRRGIAAAVPIAVALALWPTCMSPLAFSSGVC